MRFWQSGKKNFEFYEIDKIIIVGGALDDYY